ncbi:hypothetical protein CY34DRAFT_109264 [Suillus luteus UH-Slu-Lm8-n1]|uniref:Uncharacterized protein n=1 Tax=Suillus luteus UH-Slu-Lm8-n1 TaxID=930992 RepID=A0A0D0AYZ9_9AGAM|nr:hypothetical protein CY34DRAFT_109264 [Suillus luteus UH-Slu-Lm8-n1]
MARLQTNRAWDSEVISTTGTGSLDFTSADRHTHTSTSIRGSASTAPAREESSLGLNVNVYCLMNLQTCVVVDVKYEIQDPGAGVERYILARCNVMEPDYNSFSAHNQPQRPKFDNSHLRNLCVPADTPHPR